MYVAGGDIPATTKDAWSQSGLRPAVWVNLLANGAGARARWEDVESEVRTLLPAGTPVLCFEPPCDLRDSVRAALGDSVNCLISAGGDGTMNRLLNSLVQVAGGDLSSFAVGGIGLGSSNDFMKPVQGCIGGVPVRLDPAGMGAADIGWAVYRTRGGSLAQRAFLLNASLGVTAEANSLFNSSDRLVTVLKRRSASLAIWLTALRAILHHSDIDVELRADGTTRALRLSNLAVLKNPHVSGSLSYGSSLAPPDGRLAICCCHDMGTWDLLTTLKDLTRGRFAGSRKRVAFLTPRLAVSARSPVVLEMDGEIITSSECTFSVGMSRIRILGSGVPSQ